MANNLSGISYTSNFNNLDGLSIVDADTLIIDGVTIDPTNIVPYVGADKTVNLGAQNIQTTHAPVANADLVNLLALQQAIAYVDAGVAASFLNKVTTNNQTVAGNVQMNGGLTLTQNTVCNQLQLQSDDNTTMSWTTSVSNGANHDLTLHAVQTSKDVVFRDTGYVEAEGVKVNGATALRAVVTDANKNLATSATTATEIGYLSGVTSGVQSQLNAKASITYVDTQDGLRVLKAGDTMTGNLVMSGATTKITQSYNATTSDTTTLVNRQTLDSAIAGLGAGILNLNNTWTGTNQFNNTVNILAPLNLVGTEFTVGGATTTFYPVVIDTAASWEKSGKFYFGINRGSVHLNATWRGSLTSWFEGHVTNWGNGANYTSWNIVNAVSPSTYTRFIANVVPSTTSTLVTVWLRGSTTYYFSGVGAYLYFGNPGGDASYTLPLGSGAEVVTSTTSLSTGFDSQTISGNSLTNLYTNGGSLGIGMIPTSALSVNGDIIGSGLITIPGTIRTGNSHVFHGTPYNGWTEAIYFDGTESGSPERIYGSIQCYFKSGTYSSYGTELQFYTRSVATVSAGRPQLQRMVISPEGNVGIGETDPSAKLQVSGRGLFGYVYNSTPGIFIDNADAYGGYPCIQGVTTTFGANSIIINPAGGNVGITQSPQCKLQTWGGAVNFNGGSNYAVANGYMGNGSLTIGDHTKNYGGGTNWSTNTAGLMLECYDTTEIVIHDSGARLASFAYYSGNVFYMGRDMGYGSSSFFFKGEVCIGKVNNLFPNTITFPLWVSNGINYTWFLAYYLYSGGLPNHNANGTWPVSIWAENAIVTSQWFGTVSDRRIKKNIKPVGSMLDTINRIEVVSFDFIDPTRKRDECGVIAQQVEEVFPNAIDKSNGFIPNVLKSATAVTKLDDKRLQVLFGRTNEDIQVGDFIKLLSDTKDETKHDSKEHVTRIIELVDGGIVVELWKDYKEDDEHFIVYGKQVDDFRNVDKEQLGILALKGVQELSAMVQTLNARNVILEEHARKIEEDLKTTMDAFSAYKEITEARLNKLASLVAQLIK